MTVNDQNSICWDVNHYPLLVNIDPYQSQAPKRAGCLFFLCEIPEGFPFDGKCVQEPETPNAEESLTRLQQLRLG